MKLQELTGQKFGKLYVLRKADNKKNRVHWVCKCDCGKQKTVAGSHLKNGHTKSCGCLHSFGSVLKWCKQCGVRFMLKKARLNDNKNRGTFCKDYCYKQYQKNSGYRDGDKNPAYKNGYYTSESLKNPKRKKTMRLHVEACRKYKEAFIKKNETPFCEVCKVNQNGTFRFEVHHIYYASRYPKHKELHNFKNLIHVCRECHDKFHSGKYINVFTNLEKERGLKELFIAT